jgi:predicted Rossmann fold nucleotide-binding protein DprA/Smf involved in DNA uptake
MKMSTEELTEETAMDFTGAPEAPEAPEAEAAETGETAEASEEATAKGRPRDPGAVDRDEKVLAAVAAGPKTRDQIATELEIAGNLVYLSLWRLRNAGKVAKLNGKTWALPGTVLPEPAPKAAKTAEEPADEDVAAES